MPTPEDLMGLGMPAMSASLIGQQVTPGLVGTGTAQVGATPIRTKSVELNPTGGNTAYILPDLGVNVPFILTNISATAALIFPPVGHNMNGTLNASFSVPQFKPTTIIEYKKNNWSANLSA